MKYQLKTDTETLTLVDVRDNLDAGSTLVWVRTETGERIRHATTTQALCDAIDTEGSYAAGVFRAIGISGEVVKVEPKPEPVAPEPEPEPAPESAHEPAPKKKSRRKRSGK